MELNPYWNVPQSIIRKEIIPTYRRDTTYFTRNRMKVYDKNGLQVDPHSIKWGEVCRKWRTLYGEAGQQNREFLGTYHLPFSQSSFRISA